MKRARFKASMINHIVKIFSVLTLFHPISGPFGCPSSVWGSNGSFVLDFSDLWHVKLGLQRVNIDANVSVEDMFYMYDTFFLARV